MSMVEIQGFFFFNFFRRGGGTKIEFQCFLPTLLSQPNVHFLKGNEFYFIIAISSG